jgi:serine/threonine protein kinase
VTHSTDEGATAALLGGRYLLHECIGQGAMAKVYRAEDVTLGRPVAVKMMRETPEGTAPTPRARTEMALLASLNHPSLVTLYDAMVEPGQPEYLVMELIDGTSLAETLRERRMDAADVAVLAAELAGALHIVHSAGIVHRDIKPSNVLMATDPIPGRRPRAKLADFGVALLADAERLTSPGLVVGTAAYLAPEQVRGAAPAPPADIYALGLVLREALTGERAYPEATGIGSVMARLVEAPSLPSWLGPEWTALLTSMLAAEPAARPTALEIMEAAAELPPVTAPPPSLAVVPPVPALPADLSPAPLLPPPTIPAAVAAGSARVLGSDGMPTAALPAVDPALHDDPLSVFDVLHTPDADESDGARPHAAPPAADAPRTRREHRAPRRRRMSGRTMVLIGAALAAVAVLGVNAATWVGSVSGGTTQTIPSPSFTPTEDAVVAESDEDESSGPAATVVEVSDDEGATGTTRDTATTKTPSVQDAKKAARDAQKAADEAQRDAEKKAREEAREAGKKPRDEQRRSHPGRPGKGGPGDKPGKGAGKGPGTTPGPDTLTEGAQSASLG